MNEVKKALIEKYESTGKIGFAKPSNQEEAYALINLIAESFVQEEVSISIQDIINDMKKILEE